MRVPIRFIAVAAFIIAGTLLTVTTVVLLPLAPHWGKGRYVEEALVQCIRTIPERGTFCLTYSRDGSVLVGGITIDGDHKARGGIGFWDAATGRLLRVLKGTEGHVYGARLSSDERMVGTVEIPSGTRALWDVKEGVIKKQWTDQVFGKLAFHPSRSLWAFHTMPDTRTKMATCLIAIGDYVSGKTLFQLHHGDAGVSGMCFSPDGRTLATGASDGEVRLWDVGSGKPVRALHEHRHQVLSVTYSSSGLIASGGWAHVAWKAESELFLWKGDPPRGVRLESDFFHRFETESLTFAHDGAFLVAAGGMTKGEIGVWGTRTGKLLWKHRGGQPYSTAACSPVDDQVALAHGGHDNIEIWDFSALRERD